MYRYYSLKRPILPGGLPKQDGVINIVNFDEQTYCDEVKRKAFGYVEYDSELPQSKADSYELTVSGTKDYYCVITALDINGKFLSAVAEQTYSSSKPVNKVKELQHSDIYYDWFDSKEEAVEYVEMSPDYLVRRSKLFKRVSKTSGGM